MTGSRSAGATERLRALRRRAWRRWTLVARGVGDAQAHVLLAMFYFVVVPPFALIVRLVGDPLALAPKDGGCWVERPPTDPTLDAARRQF